MSLKAQYASVPIADPEQPLLSGQKGYQGAEGQKVQVVVVEQEPSFPVGFWLFFAGFVFPISWILGSFIPARPRFGNEFSWRRSNRIMCGIVSVTVLLSTVVFIILAIIAAQVPTGP